MRAKLIAYNLPKSQGGCDDFSLHSYWGSSYKNVLYIDGDQGRPEFETTITNVVHLNGQNERISISSVEKHNLVFIANIAWLPFLHSIDKHEVKELQFLDDGRRYSILNIDIDDSGQRTDLQQLVTITFEESISNQRTDDIIVLSETKVCSFDIDNSGTPVQDGLARFDGSVFQAWQLYYEADGTTPATSGDITLLAKATNAEGLNNLVGVFSGSFGDNFSDSTKWQSTQSIWSFFTGTVGHTNQITFDKSAYAIQNGYYSTETEDNAVQIEWELRIDSSDFVKVTLDYVLSVWGAFSSSRVQNFTTGQYGVYTMGKPVSTNTLSTIQDVRRPAGGGSAVAVTNFNLTSQTASIFEYSLGVAPSGETIYEGVLTTNGGYTANCFRGANSNANFIITHREVEVEQELNVENFTIGDNPFEIRLLWQYQRDTSQGAFSVLGNLTAQGDAYIAVDGVVQSNLNTILPSDTFKSGATFITLPDKQTHIISLVVPTDQGYEIKTEFEAQIKPLY